MSENYQFWAKKFVLSKIIAIFANINKVMTQKKSFYSSVPGSRLRSLAKSVRDYSKPTLNEIVEKARDSLNKAKPSKWIKIISTPMGGKNKR